jgi:fanconi-associated nuclease 1
MADERKHVFSRFRGLAPQALNSRTRQETKLLFMLFSFITLLQTNGMPSTIIKHPKSTNFDEGASDVERAVKRPRTNDRTWVSRPQFPSRASSGEIPDSEEEYTSEDEDEATVDYRTDLEIALPQVKNDEEAIEEYELRRAAERAEQESLPIEGDGNKKRWRSSIYVDAFNLALQTVLEEESHLFNEPEKAVFRHWNDLDYESQYLYVMYHWNQYVPEPLT